MNMKIEPVALTTDDQPDKSLDHVTQVLGPQAEIKSMPRPQEIADKGDDQDPDMVILRELEAEAKAEAAKNPEDPAAETPAQKLDDDEIADALPPAKTEETPPAAPAPKADDNIMIPKKRLDAEIAKRLDAENKANYFKGVADASKAMAKTAKAQPAAEAPPAAPVPTLDDQLNELDTKRIELAEKYDKGELTSVDWKRQELAIERESRALQKSAEEARLNEVRQQASQDAQRLTTEAQLNSITADLEAKHPYCAEMKPRDWAFLNDVATEQLLSEGKFTAHQMLNDLNGIAAFRQRLAELTDTLGANLIGKPVRGQTPPSSSQAQPTQGTAPKPKTGLSETAQARKEKLDLAKTQPPTTSTMGTGGGANEITMSDIDRMSEEDIAALPQAVLNRLKLAA